MAEPSCQGIPCAHQPAHSMELAAAAGQPVLRAPQHLLLLLAAWDCFAHGRKGAAFCAVCLQVRAKDVSAAGRPPTARKEPPGTADPQ